jgi:hypothetical protein
MNPKILAVGLTVTWLLAAVRVWTTVSFPSVTRTTSSASVVTPKGWGELTEWAKNVFAPNLVVGLMTSRVVWLKPVPKAIVPSGFGVVAEAVAWADPLALADGPWDGVAVGRTVEVDEVSPVGGVGFIEEKRRPRPMATTIDANAPPIESSDS